MKNAVENLGVGIGYRSDLRDFVFSKDYTFDYIGVTAESYMISSTGNTSQLHFLEKLSEQFVVLPHGVNLSIGSPNIDQHHLKEVKRICDITRCPFYSEHLAITKMPGITLGHLSPIPYTDDMLKRVVEHINYVQDYIERSLLIENIAYHFVLGDSPFAEVDFLNALVAETNCGILLDVANLNANALNNHFSPYEYINRLNSDRIVQIHIAGGDYDESGYLHDTHGSLVENATWELLDYVLNKTNINAILLEHDQDFPPTEYLVAQLEIAKKLLENSQEVTC